MGDHGARHLSPLFSRRILRRNSSTGEFTLSLGDDYREMLAFLAPQFAELFDDPDHPALKRVFPPAYSDPAHAEQQDEYRRLMQEDLVSRHKEELNLMVETAQAKTLTEEQVLAWIRSINSIRLVLGTALDIADDDDYSEPSSPDEAVYRWLTYLLGELIEALSGQT